MSMSPVLLRHAFRVVVVAAATALLAACASASATSAVSPVPRAADRVWRTRLPW
ncbi:hypothetical protein [Brevundimonas sp. SL161]|uniref:hypothetical protein n=1 Tax=Brevundimonas sp. SL161 TaxID=2804613 RepID=UPI003CEB2011